MQTLGMSVSNLKKVPAMSQGTQVSSEQKEDVIEIELDPDNNPQNIIQNT